MECDRQLDCIGLFCPLPILKLAKMIRKLKSGEVLEMKSNDPVSGDDVTRWCEKSGNELLETIQSNEINCFYIKKK